MKIGDGAEQTLLHTEKRRIRKQRSGTPRNVRGSARMSWVCAGPPSLERGARQGRRQRRRQGVQRKSKKSGRTVEQHIYMC
eukprot:2408855-Pyramimonas_sp.AAC.1